MTDNGPVQTREENENGLKFFNTVKEAFDYAKDHQDVWKISWFQCGTEHIRFVRVENTNQWIFEPIVFDRLLS